MNNSGDLKKDMKEAAGGSHTSIDDLKSRGVKKVKVFTPEKIEELINKRAAGLLARKRDKILLQAREKVQPIVKKNRELDRRIQALTSKLDSAQKTLESEQAKAFQRGTESQKPVVERYQDEVLSLKSRIKDLEGDNRVLLKQQDEQARDALTQYREQIALLSEDVKRMRSQMTAPKKTAVRDEVLKEYQAEMQQIQRQIASIAERDLQTGMDMKKMVAEMEKNIAAGITEKIDRLKTPQKRTAAVLPKDVMLDNLFKDLPETNPNAMKVRQNSGRAIDDSLEKLVDFHDNRQDLELHRENND